MESPSLNLLGLMNSILSAHRKAEALITTSDVLWTCTFLAVLIKYLVWVGKKLRVPEYLVFSGNLIRKLKWFCMEETLIIYQRQVFLTRNILFASHRYKQTNWINNLRKNILNWGLKDSVKIALGLIIDLLILMSKEIWFRKYVKEKKMLYAWYILFSSHDSLRQELLSSFTDDETNTQSV